MTATALAQRFPWDALERVGWTAVESAAGLLIVAVTPLTTWWALPIGLAVAAVKAFAAKQLGQPGTASTLPASKDPAAVVPLRTGGLPPTPPAL